MERISEIFIKSFKCLNCFSLDLNIKDNNTLNCNINLLIGRNGAGKSTFLDALFEIAINTNNPDRIFRHYLKSCNGNIICGNCSPVTYENIEAKSKDFLWKKVIRFYTGNSDRHIEYKKKYTEAFLSFERDKVKFILSALFISGAWKSDVNNKIISKFKEILFEDKSTFEPEQVWIDVKNYNKETFEIKNKNFIEKEMPKCTRLYLNITDADGYVGASFSILNTLLNHLIEKDNTNNEENSIFDTGFLYKRLNSECNSDSLYVDETLSDGELGFIRRFSLILLMSELKGEENRSLLLLDEPETHFNENWKRHFIYLIEAALKNTYHDIFIATHSAMLITDVKRDELYRFECTNNKIKTYPVNINTFATNVVNIGQALFDLESDIGERSKKELEQLINGIDQKTNEPFKNNKKHKKALQDKLREVGPGEWRWKIRSKINQLEKADLCCNFNPKKVENGDSTGTN